MENLNGKKLYRFPLENLRKIADLIYFDGIFLSEFRRDDGESFLYCWCDSDDQCNRWLVFNVAQIDLMKYYFQEMSLLQLIENPKKGFIYAVDIDQNYEYSNIVRTTSTELPKSYLPDEDSYYEFEPSYVNLEQRHDLTGNHAIFIDKSWSLDDLSKFPHIYSQIYSFIYSINFSSNDENSVHDLRKTYSRHSWNSGFSAMHFYNSLASLIPVKERPKIIAMRYASPGKIELSVSTVVAEDVTRIIANFVQNYLEIDAFYKDVYKELKRREFIGHKPTMEIVLDRKDKEYLSDSLEEFARLLKFGEMNKMNEMTNNLLVSMKILMSFFRRIDNISGYYNSGRVIVDR